MGENIQYDHDIMRPYLSNDQIALDTEITYAKAIRLQMGGKWKETADLYIKIANRGHPTAQGSSWKTICTWQRGRSKVW